MFPTFSATNIVGEAFLMCCLLSPSLCLMNVFVLLLALCSAWSVMVDKLVKFNAIHSRYNYLGQEMTQSRVQLQFMDPKAACVGYQTTLVSQEVTKSRITYLPARQVMSCFRVNHALGDNELSNVHIV